MPYTPVWGGGVSACPISAAELWRAHLEHGWPKDDEVYSASDFHVKCDGEADFSNCASFDLWGCTRSAFGVCRATLPHAKAWEMTHRGLCNFLEHMPRAAADAGDVLIMVEGELREVPGKCERQLAIIAGTCWSPKVFDLVRC